MTHVFREGEAPARAWELESGDNDNFCIGKLSPCVTHPFVHTLLPSPASEPPYHFACICSFDRLTLSVTQILIPPNPSFLDFGDRSVFPRSTMTCTTPYLRAPVHRFAILSWMDPPNEAAIQPPSHVTTGRRLKYSDRLISLVHDFRLLEVPSL